MKQITIGFDMSALILALAVICAAQASRIVSETRLTDDSGGYSFSVPAGWKSNKGEAGFALVNPANTILIAVKPHNYDSFEAAVKDTKLDNNAQVRGKPQDLQNGGKTVRVAQRTAKGLLIVDFFVLFSPNGGGAAIIAMSDTANADTSFKQGLAVSGSVAFVKPSQSGSVSPWRTALAGKHLLYLYSGDGYFEEKHIYLCSPGEFVQTTGSGGFSPGDADGGSFAGRGGKRGSWTVSGSVLVLRFQDGSVGRYEISRRQASNEVGLNGKRYFVQSQNICR